MSEEMIVFEGVPITPGVAIGPVFVQRQDIDITEETIPEHELSSELERLQDSLEQTRSQIEEVKQNVAERMGDGKAEIFQAHLMMLDDPELIPSIEEVIREQQKNAEYAVKQIIEQYAEIFEAMEDEYLKARGSDIEDVGNRIIRNLSGNSDFTGEPDQKQVIVAREIAPSQIVQFNPDNILAVVTAEGSRTSHAAIMARSLGFQTVMGVGDQLLERAENNDRIIVDGTEGKVILQPNSETLQEYEERREEFLERERRLDDFRSRKAKTRDGEEIEVVGNIGNLAEVELVLEEGGEGVGLFRTEFIYMDRNRLPTEDEQFEIYRDVAREMEDRPLVIRTLDIGGDKTLPYLDPPDEMNPFLGFRAIRMCLERVEEIFLPQLRALLRASAHGNVKIMFPMISSLEQLREARSILKQAQRQLDEEGQDYDPEIEVGIMIEVPSTVMIAGHLAREVDFFSIGTNDLTQFTLAVDRTNKKVSGHHTPYHPAVMRMVKMTIEAGHEHGIWVGMCGEAAGEPDLMPFLLGAGLDEFSMSAISIPQIKEALSHWTREEARQVTDRVLTLGTTGEVKAYLNEVIQDSSTVSGN